MFSYFLKGIVFSIYITVAIAQMDLLVLMVAKHRSVSLRITDPEDKTLA